MNSKKKTVYENEKTQIKNIIFCSLFIIKLILKLNNFKVDKNTFLL